MAITVIVTYEQDILVAKQLLFLNLVQHYQQTIHIHHSFAIRRITRTAFRTEMVDIQYKALTALNLLKSARHHAIVVVATWVMIAILQVAIWTHAVGAIDIPAGDGVTIAPALRYICIARFFGSFIHRTHEHLSCTIAFLYLANSVDIGIDMRERLADFLCLNSLLLFGSLAMCIAAQIVEIVLDIGCTYQQTLGHLGLWLGLVILELWRSASQ